ncbi:hypothetical protein A7A08_02879 [Methyloligella halotolerans]|uniref:YecR-like lipoprotein n=1 Tax=Methyloligella halotolerans TaxID=1177755 RepID=A0A1E2RVP5_9HYPH|nr:YecR family lipoprotein [Methyloligella halotolerans]ODA66232.1 hypothetical protein A7A08_02879 [Methyloligella halotolerans]
MSFRTASCVLIVILAGGAISCAKNKELVATGGSRADGTVDLSYEYAALEKPVVNEAQGLITAQQKCAAWGYSGAEAFGGRKEECQYANEYGCMKYFVTVKYQCTGASKL